MAIAMAQINETPPPLPEHIDAKLQKLIMDCMAKKPDQRPSSALALAARAEALLSTAPGAIPINAVIPAGTIEVSDETTLIDTNTKPTAPVPAVWPWLALIIILLTTIAVITWAGVVAPKPTISPSPSPSQTVSKTPTPTPTPTEETVAILLSSYQELDVSLVVPQLSQLGLVVDPIAGTTVPADDPRISQVYSITPLGNVVKGSTVQVYYYQQEPDPNTVVE
jgi:serine/threonine protein kinase